MLIRYRYIRCDELAQVSRKQVEDGTMQIHPSGHTQDWYRWLGKEKKESKGEGKDCKQAHV